MYKEFFGLRANPFNVNPDPRYLFLTRHTEEALACLTYGIQSRKGFVLLTGEVGTGKTTLINKLLEWLRLQQVATAFIFNSRLNTTQFLDYMMADFGIPCDSKAKSQILLRLYNWLLDRYRAGETAVLIVDEAQNLTEEVLEEIRMLTNLETFYGKVVADRASGPARTGAKIEAAATAAIAAKIDAARQDTSAHPRRKQSVCPAAAAYRGFQRPADL